MGELTEYEKRQIEHKKISDALAASARTAQGDLTITNEILTEILETLKKCTITPKR